MSNNFDLDTNKNLLTKKRESPLNENNIKVTNYNNFCLLKSNCGHLVIHKNIDEKNIKKYLNDKKNKKLNYIDNVKKNIKQENTIDDNYDLEEPLDDEIKSFQNMKLKSIEEINILNYVKKPNAKMKIFKRMYIDFPSIIYNYLR